MCVTYKQSIYIHLFNDRQFSITFLSYFISDSILLYLHTSCCIMHIYFYIYIPPDTIVIYFLYTLAIQNLFSQACYIHPCLYNSANSILSAENAVPQIVKTSPWLFHSPTQMPPTAKCFSPHKPSQYSVYASLVAVVYFFDLSIYALGCSSSPIKL